MKDRAVKGALLLALVCLGTCAVLRSRQPGSPLAPSPPAPVDMAAAPSRTTQENPVSRPPPGTKPIIDSITVEKEEVCEGEENLVTVQAHTPDGNDAFLHYQVGPTSGSPVAVRSYLDDRGRPTAHRVSVFGKNNAVTTVEVPSFRVKPCAASAAVVVEHRLRANTVAEFDFDVRIVSAGSQGADGAADASFRPRGFAWSFGDGTHQDGPLPHATHSFADRAQDTLYAQFLVTVEVLGEDARVLRGRHAVELLNPAFEAFAYKGVVLLFADLDPRFPVLYAEGTVDQRVRLWHARPDSVAITKATVMTRYAAHGARSAPAYPPVSSVLGATEIPPGRGLEVRVILDSRVEPDTLSRDYMLEGRTRDGHPVRGSFSVMKPPPLPSKERHDPISDPVLLAKVKMAREMLHRDYVTDEDIGALERAGKFDGLHIDAKAPAPPASPSLPARPFKR